MGNPRVSRRVARALYATPNALDPALLELVRLSTDRAESFEDLPEKVQAIVRWAEGYIGPPPGEGSLEDKDRVEEVEDGAAGA